MAPSLGCSLPILTFSYLSMHEKAKICECGSYLWKILTKNLCMDSSVLFGNIDILFCSSHADAVILSGMGINSLKGKGLTIPFFGMLLLLWIKVNTDGYSKLSLGPAACQSTRDFKGFLFRHLWFSSGYQHFVLCTNHW